MSSTPASLTSGPFGPGRTRLDPTPRRRRARRRHEPARRRPSGRTKGRSVAGATETSPSSPWVLTTRPSGTNGASIALAETSTSTCVAVDEPAAARTSVRIALMTRPCRPMTLPTSSGVERDLVRDVILAVVLDLDRRRRRDCRRATSRDSGRASSVSASSVMSPLLGGLVGGGPPRREPPRRRASSAAGFLGEPQRRLLGGGFLGGGLRLRRLGGLGSGLGGLLPRRLGLGCGLLGELGFLRREPRPRRRSWRSRCSLAAVSVGCAPLAIQASTFSTSISTVEGSRARVVAAEDLDETAVARRARIGGDDAVERRLLRAGACQADLDCQQVHLRVRRPRCGHTLQQSECS